MHDAARAFIEEMGLVGEAHGLSRIAGRMVGFLMLDANAHSLDDIAEQLQVSKASVSTNARFLEYHGLLERHSAPGDRRDFYRLGDHPWEKMYEVASQRLTRMVQLFDTHLAQMPPELETARKRLERWRTFYAFMLNDIEQKLQRWPEYLAEQHKHVQTSENSLP